MVVEKVAFYSSITSANKIGIEFWNNLDDPDPTCKISFEVFIPYLVFCSIVDNFKLDGQVRLDELVMVPS